MLNFGGVDFLENTIVFFAVLVKKMVPFQGGTFVHLLEGVTKGLQFPNYLPLIRSMYDIYNRYIHIYISIYIATFNQSKNPPNSCRSVNLQPWMGHGYQQSHDLTPRTRL